MKQPLKRLDGRTPENAIGKRFDTGKAPSYVVGVVKDFNFEAFHKPVEALRISVCETRLRNFFKD